MKHHLQKSYEFGSFRLKAAERRLMRDGEHVSLTPKAFDLLLVLVEHHGHLLEKDELLQQVWPDTFVEEANLASNISQLRKALGEGENGQRYIETVPKRGYRFVAEVTEVGQQSLSVAAPLELRESKAVEPRTARLFPSLKQNRRAVLLIFSIIVVLVAGMVVAWPWLKNWLRPQPFEKVSFTYLVTTGKPVTAAISPDGKYVAYVLREETGQSLWLKQISTSSDVQIAAPSQEAYVGLTFSRDGNHLYYSTSNDLYRLPTLGGLAVKMVSGVGIAWAFSPDERRIAFVRRGQGESELWLVNPDGSGQQKLAARKYPHVFGHRPAWSPDGKQIALVGNLGGFDKVGHDVVITINLADGKEAQLTPDKWARIGQIVWLSDSTLLINAWNTWANAIRIWRVTLPDGTAHQITTDLADYHNYSLTSDATSLAAIKAEWSESLWVAPHGDISQARQISTGRTNYEYLNWTPDGKIVAPSLSAQEPGESGPMRNLFLMDADGKNRRQLTTYGDISQQSVSPDGRYIFHIKGDKDRATHSVWRVDIDGRNPMQLTDGAKHRWPVGSPDGRWVVYLSEAPGKTTLWRVPVDGGKSEQLTTNETRSPVISPDGRWIACFYQGEEKAPPKLALLPFDGGPPAKTFDMPATAPNNVAGHQLRWLPDGKALTYKNKVGNVMSLWQQPIDGGPAKQIADFKTDQVMGFDWSRNGDLAYVTIQTDRRVVLIRDVGGK